MRCRRVILVAAVTIASCGGGGTTPIAVDAPPDSPPATDDPNSADLPPRGEALLMPWLAAGHYKTWACERGPHAEVYPSNHGDNLACNNSILHNAPAGVGNYPLDAASVKELYAAGDATLIGYSVSRKITDALGDGWYWFEVKNGKITDGMATDPIKVCTACHQCAPRDYTYAIAP